MKYYLKNLKLEDFKAMTKWRLQIRCLYTLTKYVYNYLETLPI